MTIAAPRDNPVTEAQASFLDLADGARRGRRPGRVARPRCALCAGAPPATPFGLCRECLGAAAAELARITPRSAEPDDPRPSAVNVRALCRRCGSCRHDTSECVA